MKKTFDSLNLLFNLLFISATLLLIFLMLKNPGFIFKETINFKLILIYCVLLLGLIAITLGFISSNTSIIKEIVYVNKNLLEVEKEATSVGSEIKSDDTADYEKMRAEIDNLILTENDCIYKLEKILSLICNGLEAGQGIIYTYVGEATNLKLKACATYAFSSIERPVYELGEGMVGLVVKEDRRIDIDNVPDGYIQILSGLGKASPKRLMILPLKKYEEIVGVIELAFFKPITKKGDKFLQETALKIGKLI